MTTINTSFYSGNTYASLTQQGSNATSQDKTSALGKIVQATASSALTETEATANSDSAYAINLSPQAKAYLAKLKEAQSVDTASAGFTLTRQQAEQVKDIVSKYKDEPITQDTFNKIQDDLRAAGLGAEQLSVKDQLASFNPTASLIEALNGGGQNFTVQQPAEILAQQQEKANTYLQQVEKLWRTVAAADAS